MLCFTRLVEFYIKGKHKTPIIAFNWQHNYENLYCVKKRRFWGV